ncbi:MAG TPA: S26 family signal peptidase [Planctomycetia bacterium]|nr:S26 family signal peptidase [Planctomycetia bacterium]
MSTVPPSNLKALVAVKPVPHDAFRELMETIAVVLILVCLLKGWVAEAFMIPTGSMATTLWGANRQYDCPQCGYRTLVNAPEGRGPSAPTGCMCQNCRFPIHAPERTPSFLSLAGENGNRVVVAKYIYEGHADPRRWDVPVFKYPAEVLGQEPQPSRPSQTNFIKRLVGMPNEELYLYYGDVFVRPQGAKDYGIASRPPNALMATRRLVYDNDRQAADLRAAGFPARWHALSGEWKIADDGKSFAAPAGEAWIGYRHLVGGGARDSEPGVSTTAAAGRTPQIITDWESYNVVRFGEFLDTRFLHHNWVGDLMIECECRVPQETGAAMLELVEATRVYRCTFDFAAKKIVVSQNGKFLKEAPLTGSGTRKLRFANFDDRLVVWVDGRLAFGDGVEVESLTPDQNGPLSADRQPARIGSQGVEATFAAIKLHRDTYYLQTLNQADAAFHGGRDRLRYPMEEGDATLADWRQNLAMNMTFVREQSLRPDRDPAVRVYKIPANSYLMLGDNSPLSSDGREWNRTHFAERHHLLGKAVVTFWPVEWNFKWAD